MRNRFRRVLSRPLLLCLVVLGVPGAVYAECEVSDGGGGAYVAPAPSVTPATATAGSSITLSASSVTAGWYTTLLYGGTLSSAVALGPFTDTVEAPGFGNLPPWVVELPLGLAAGAYWIYLVNEATGEVTSSASVTVQDPPQRPACAPPYRGGLLKHIMPARVGCQLHHMPSQRSYRGIANYNLLCTPAIEMVIGDHTATASYGGGPTSSRGLYRLEQRDKILEFAPDYKRGFANAFNMDVVDINGKFPSKYTGAIASAQAALNAMPQGGAVTC